MDVDAYVALAAETGIEIPGLLRKLLAAGKCDYGEDWRSTWRERLLNDPPALSSFEDFEWLGSDVARGREWVADWLNPEFQQGRRFLPFAQSGAGDAYCLMPLDGQTAGVALVWHDRAVSRIDHCSFSDFVCVQFLAAFAGLETFIEDDFSAEEALQMLRLDVMQVSECMGTRDREYLRSFLDLPLVEREWRHGPRSRPEKVLSLISQEQLEVELRRFPGPGLPEFPVVARWEVPGYAPPEPPEPVTWQSLAAHKKLEAMQLYRQEQGGSLAQARDAIESYIAGCSAAQAGSPQA